MKKIKASCIFDQIKDGDCFTEWVEDFETACKKAQSDYDRLGAFDKERRETVYVVEYEAEVEDDESADDVELIDENRTGRECVII